MLLTISGNVPSQKNGKEIAVNRATGQRFVRSNDRVTAWKQKAVESLQNQFGGYKISGYPISITCIFFFDNLRRHDLDNAVAGVMDAMVAAKIIEDDNVNFVDCLQLQYGGHDKINPRVEIYLDD
jgi:Holliday junction resolvase RusA-like endonuclease